MIILTYLGKMVLCSGILMGYYYLFLRNKRFHHYNRFYLLSTLALSLVLPWVRIPVFEDTGMLNQVAWRTAQAITIRPEAASFPEATEEVSSSVLIFSNLLWVVYGTGLLVCLAILLLSLRYIRKISCQYPYELINQLRFYQTREPGTPFSFFRSIFWNDQLSLTSQEGQQIFRHELFHVQQKHSIDILLAELVTIIGWFNPFFHLIKKELRAIHEFLADQYAASGSNRYQYAELLVEQVLASRQLSLTHPFFQNHLKRRIAMITQHHASRYGYWSRLMVLPLSAILFLSVTLYAREKHTPVVNKTATAFTEADISEELPAADTVPAKPREEKKAAKEKVVRDKVIIVEGKPAKSTAQPVEVVVEGKRTPVKGTAKLDEVVVVGRSARDQTTVQPDEVVVVGKRTPAKTTVKLDEVVVEGRPTHSKNTVQPDEVVVVGKRTPAKTNEKLEEVVVEGKPAQAPTTVQPVEVVVVGKRKEKSNANREDMALNSQQEVKELPIQEKELRTPQEAVSFNEVVVQGRRKTQGSYTNPVDSVQNSLNRYFFRNFRYPQELIDNSGEGSVWYSFFMGPGGGLWNFNVYNEAPPHSAGRIQEIVIVGYADKPATGTLNTEKKQELFKQEVLRVLEKSAGAIKVNRNDQSTYYYKATFRLEKKQ